MQYLNKHKPSILHLTPHLGGGVGAVTLNYIENDLHFEHKIICLDYANDYAKELCARLSIELEDNMHLNEADILQKIKKSDIVLVHFWNHPLLYKFLVSQKLPPSRVVFWSHISGCCPPHNFTKKVLTYPDLFVFNTPLAFENEVVESLSKDQKEKIKVIWATAGIDEFTCLKKIKKTSFNIGYVGTVDYCRMRKDFLNICSDIKIEDIKFIVCGGNKEEEISNQAKEMGVSELFDFTGKVNNIAFYMSIFDVFGYPLVENHSGTCDLVLQEAMAAGAVPVVFDNPMERYIVKDGITGVVVKSADEYKSAIEVLYNNVELRKTLSSQAKKYAIDNFSLNSLIGEWEKTFKEVLKFSKSEKKWSMDNLGEEYSYKNIFFEALGDYSKPFKAYFEKSTRDDGCEKIARLAKMQIWQGDSKGTVHQYYKFFPESEELQVLSDLMNDLSK